MTRPHMPHGANTAQAAWYIPRGILILVCICIQVVALLGGGALWAEDSRTYNFYRDEGHWYTVELPRTHWRYQPDVAQAAGMDSFFIVSGYSVDDSPAALMSIVSYPDSPDVGFEDWIAWERAATVRANPGIEYTTPDWGVENVHGHAIELRRIASTDGVTRQYAAYINGGVDYFVAFFLQLYEDEAYYAEQLRAVLRTVRLLPYSLRLE